MPKSAPAETPIAARRCAERALEAAAALSGVMPNELLYSRVDLASTATGDYLLLELELIEPSLFLLHAPNAAEQFADGLFLS